MINIIKMPKLGATMKQGTITEWRVKEGDHIKKGDILFIIETDKLTNEFESDVVGIVRKILVLQGETVSCQTPLVIVTDADEDISEYL